MLSSPDSHFQWRILTELRERTGQKLAWFVSNRISFPSQLPADIAQNHDLHNKSASASLKMKLGAGEGAEGESGFSSSGLAQLKRWGIALLE